MCERVGPIDRTIRSSAAASGMFSYEHGREPVVSPQRRRTCEAVHTLLQAMTTAHHRGKGWYSGTRTPSTLLRPSRSSLRWPRRSEAIPHCWASTFWTPQRYAAAP